MSDLTSLFNKQPDGATPPAGNTGNDALATLLADIKNADGQPKYKDVETALNALKSSQEFIPSLQRESQEQKAEIERLKTQAARAAELEALVASLTQTPPSNTSTPSSTPPAKTLDVAAEVRNALQLERQAEVAKTNANLVVTKVAAAFGAEAEAKFYGKATEMGMSVAEFNALAAKSPKVVLTMFGLAETPDAPKPNTAPTSSSVNSNGFVPKPDSAIGRNKNSIMLGATTQQVIDEVRTAKRMVEELHDQGLTINDLTNPKVFFKHFA